MIGLVKRFVSGNELFSDVLVLPRFELIPLGSSLDFRLVVVAELDDDERQ